MNQNIADLLGIDLTDPETIASLAEIDEIQAIRARAWTVLQRTGTTEAALAELIGVDPAKISASLAGDRRFSTYELAAIAEHGGTTVEWLCGDEDGAWGSADDEPAEPNPRIQAAAAEMRAERTPTPERDGYTIAVYLPPGVSASTRDFLFRATAALAHDADDGQGWDAHVIGQAGDLLRAVDGQARP